MKKLSLLILAFAIPSGASQSLPGATRNAPGNPASQSVTGEQLEGILAGSKENSDSQLARKLYSLEPAERLSASRIAGCETYLPGPEARQAFMVFADQSMFLNLPAADTLSLPTPDVTAQKKMLALTADYVSRTLHRLPNFYATRSTTTFRRDTRSQKPMRPIGEHSVTVYYRNGGEVLKSKNPWSRVRGLTTSGEFGPILGTTMLDAAKGNLTWSHWEKGTDGPMAVYSYEITAADSHYIVDAQKSGYVGEIAIDASTGTILRLMLKSEMNPLLGLFYSGPWPIIADIEVDYGPVNLGGKTFICPLKGVALSQASRQIWLNEVVFGQYHLFSGETRVLPGFGVVH